MVTKLSSLVFVLCLIVTTAYSKSVRTTYPSYRTEYIRTEFRDKSDTYSKDFGQLASFSNKSVSSVRGRLYEPDTSFGCVVERNNKTIQYPKEPFVVFLPISDCNSFSQCQYAEQIGAVGVLYYSPETSDSLSAYHTALSVVVGLVKLTDDEVTLLKRGLKWNETYITIEIKETSYSIGTSHTFYFVVFAFSVLILLSITWFIVTYLRRCHGMCVQKYRRSTEQRSAVQTINRLPTRKYKVVKTRDRDSVISDEEPTCAVCLEIFQANDSIRILPCKHEFHQPCVDPWLRTKGTCPLCKYNVIKKEPASSVTYSVTSNTIQLNERTSDDEEEEEARESEERESIRLAAISSIV